MSYSLFRKIKNILAISIPCLSILLPFAFRHSIVSGFIILAIMVVVAILLIILFLLFGKCPSCKKHVLIKGISGPYFCPYCGEILY